MKPVRNQPCPRRQGSALVLSLIFVVMFSALAAAMAGMSGVNVQIANNQREAGQALSSAHSGIEVVRYYLDGISVPTGAPSTRLEKIAQSLQTKLAGVPNISVSYDSTLKKMTIPAVELATGTNTNFTAAAVYGRNADGSPNYDVVEITVTGNGGDVIRQVGVSFCCTEIGNPIFDFGIATKGPLSTQGSVDVDTFNEKYWADVYIESLNSNLALDMSGKSSIAGTVTIANGAANVLIGASSSVGGAKGANAMKYVTLGADACTFPTPNTAEFEGYVQTDFQAGDPTSNATLKNVRIPAGLNPTFSGNTVVNGLLYIEQPNAVSFTGGVQVNGLIVAEGDVSSPLEGNSLDFGGNVGSQDVSTLSAGEYGTLTEHTGTFILAPGFKTNFRGSFSALNGVIASSGVSFSGNAGGTINGSVINYSDTCMELAGNTDLVFNRTGVEKRPAGFEPYVSLQFLSTSYQEPM